MNTPRLSKVSALVRHWKTLSIFNVVLASSFSGFTLAAQIGTVDPSFNVGSGPSDRVGAMVLQSDNKVVIAGPFTSVGGSNRSQIARLNDDGSLDTIFNLSVNNSVNALALQPDGKLLIAGNFTSIQGTNRTRLARINIDGNLDESFFVPPMNINNPVYALALQPGGMTVIAGDFSFVNGVARFSGRATERGRDDRRHFRSG